MTRHAPFWILDATLVTQNAKREVKAAHLYIENGRIAEILDVKKSKTKFASKYSKTKKINARGLTVLPGFVQAHVHLCQTLLRNAADDLELLDWLSERVWVMEAAHTAQTLEASSWLGIYELLSSGTTCILDMGTVRHTEAIFKAVRDSGIRANVGKCLMDHPETTPPTLREPTHQALEEAASLFRKWNGTENDRIRAHYAPRFVVSCTERLLQDVGALAKSQKALIHTHASENLKEIQLVKKLVGCENVEYLDGLGLMSESLVLAHCIWLKPHEMELLKKSKTHVVHCPSSNLKLASGLARVPEMLAKGINVALGADGAPCNNNLNAFQEMRLAALIHKPGQGPKAVRAQEALDMATLNGAKALHWDQDIGSIEVGKKADLTLMDLNSPENAVSPLFLAKKSQTFEAYASAIVYSSQPQHVLKTWVDGQCVFERTTRGAQLTRLTRKMLMEKVRRAHSLLLSR